MNVMSDSATKKRRSFFSIPALFAGLLLCLVMRAEAADDFANFKMQPTQATPHQWALTASAAIALTYGCQRVDVLGWDEMTEKNIERHLLFLRNSWGVNNHDDAVQTVKQLREGMHRGSFQSAGAALAALTTEELMAKLDAASEAEKFRMLVLIRNYEAQGERGILAWDLVRAIHVAAWSWMAGYLSEEEAWGLMMPVTRELQKNFKSWDDLTRNYMIGREYWSYTQTKEVGQKFRDAHKMLMDDPQSPYHTVPWDLDLGK